MHSYPRATFGILTLVVGLAYQALATAGADSSGSGFIVHTDGYILSNAHVVEGAKKLEVVLHDGTVCNAKVVEADEYKDLALLKITAAGLTAAPMGDSARMDVMDSVMAIGFPLGTALGSAASGYDGKINAIRDEGKVPRFQIDATVNHGNSGGPLANERGEVIGVIVAKIKTTVAERIGFAIPLKEAKSLLRHAYPYGVPTGKNTAKLSSKEIFQSLKPSTVLILNYSRSQGKPLPPRVAKPTGDTKLDKTLGKLDLTADQKTKIEAAKAKLGEYMKAHAEELYTASQLYAHEW